MWSVVTAKVHRVIYFQSIIKTELYNCMETFRTMTYHWLTWNIYANVLNLIEKYALASCLFSYYLNTFTKEHKEQNINRIYSLFVLFWTGRHKSFCLYSFFFLVWDKLIPCDLLHSSNNKFQLTKTNIFVENSLNVSIASGYKSEFYRIPIKKHKDHTVYEYVCLQYYPGRTSRFGADKNMQ